MCTSPIRTTPSLRKILAGKNEIPVVFLAFNSLAPEAPSNGLFRCCEAALSLCNSARRRLTWNRIAFKSDSLADDVQRPAFHLFVNAPDVLAEDADRDEL